MSPSSPTPINIPPTVLTLKPFVWTLTAKAIMAPAAMSTRLVPIPTTRFTGKSSSSDPLGPRRHSIPASQSRNTEIFKDIKLTPAPSCRECGPVVDDADSSPRFQEHDRCHGDDRVDGAHR